MREFSDLVDEAAAVDVSGWSFDWLDGRATEERPPWGYSRLLAARLADAGSALDIDTGGGEIIAEVPRLPARMVVTEGWPPNVERARHLLSGRGVQVVHVEQGRPLPFPDAGFDLVSSRHPVAPDWPEIARVLADGGTYLAQHVGAASAFELIEWFLGPLPRERLARDPERETEAARLAGLRIVDLRTARCRMEFFDIGAVVYILRKCVWWVPGFTVEDYREPLERLDAHIRAHGAFVAHSTRTLLEAERAPRARDRTPAATRMYDDGVPAARCDGLYISGQRQDSDSRSIVRFLTSGEVVTAGVGSDDHPATLAGKVARWLAPGHPHVSTGRCEIDDAGLRFVASSSSGDVAYAGRISQDGLAMELTWHSAINGNSGTERYEFVPVPSLEDEPDPVGGTDKARRADGPTPSG